MQTISTTKTLDPKHPDWKPFVKAMRAARDDDTPRLVFADWLEETFGENAFASFIREHIEYCRDGRGTFPFGHTPKMLSVEWFKQQKISDYFCRCWGPKNWDILKGLHQREPNTGPDHASMWSFDRGFPNCVACPYDWWASNAPRLCAIGPVGSVILTDYPRVHRTAHFDGGVLYRLLGTKKNYEIVWSTETATTRHGTPPSKTW